MWPGLDLSMNKFGAMHKTLTEDFIGEKIRLRILMGYVQEQQQQKEKQSLTEDLNGLMGRKEVG